jgi:hypothetical protein
VAGFGATAGAVVARGVTLGRGLIFSVVAEAFFSEVASVLASVLAAAFTSPSVFAFATAGPAEGSSATSALAAGVACVASGEGGRT